MNPQFLQALMQALGVRPPQNQALDRVAAQGRGGDTMLAHINPREAEMLKEAGGSGTINPKTGLPEFADALGGGGSTGGGGSGGGMQEVNVGPTPGSSIGTPAGDSQAPGFGWSDAAKLAGTGLAGLVGSLSPAAPAMGIASNIYGGKAPEDLSQKEVASMAPFGGAGYAIGSGLNAIASMVGLENQGLGAPNAQPGASDIGAYQPGYLPQATNPAAATPGAAATPTSAELDLAKRGFYTTPQTASLVQPSSAIDPVLQSAMLYARG